MQNLRVDKELTITHDFLANLIFVQVSIHILKFSPLIPLDTSALAFKGGF